MAERKQQEEEKGESAPLWFITYADMITLLLCFFIMLLSFATLDNKKMKVAVESLRGALGVESQVGGSMSGNVMVMDPVIPELSHPNMSTRESIIKRERTEMKNRFDKEYMSSDVESGLTERGIILTILDSVLFDVGSSTLKPEAEPVLSEVARIIGTMDADIRIVGHTDDNPVPLGDRAKYASNWELSTARAMSVMKYMLNSESMDPTKMTVCGRGQVQPREPNDTPDGRRKNRRVEIIVEPVDLLPSPALNSQFLPGQVPAPHDDLPK